MSQPTLPPTTTSTVSMFSLTDALGIDPNLLVDAVREVDSRPGLALRKLVQLRDVSLVLERRAVQQLRREKRSWDYIGERLGMSKQAARKRHPDVD